LPHGAPLAHDPTGGFATGICALNEELEFMTLCRPLLSVLAVSLIAFPSSLLADDVMPGTEAPSVEEAPAIAAPAPETEPTAAPQSPVSVPALAREQLLLWRLLGGGEVLGSLVKETPRSFYIDIGPTVIDVPRDSVVDQVSLAQRDETVDSPLGLGSGVFDPSTGSVIFSAGQARGRLLSQREVLENVKRSVVLVSNPRGLGTGWVVSEDGRIVTNQHVVGRELFQTITIFVKNGDQWERRRIENCRVHSYSDLLDIAIVQLDMDRVRELGITLNPLTVAPPGSLESGDAVYAVGNPGMGFMVLDHTVSEGIVSSLARNFNDVVYLQTTAAVNPGNSGGPLVNTRGEVVGLITLKAMFQEGVAFALPVDYIHQYLRYSEAFAVSELYRNQGFRYHRPE
jgi:serine protease Do